MCGGLGVEQVASWDLQCSGGAKPPRREGGGGHGLTGAEALAGGRGSTGGRDIFSSKIVL